MGSKKATQVFSSAKYPGPQKLSDFEILYGKTEDNHVSRKTYSALDRRIVRQPRPSVAMPLSCHPRSALDRRIVRFFLSTQLQTLGYGGYRFRCTPR